MKYHKIPGVEKTVCTAEQMLAYNITWRNWKSWIDRGLTVKEAALECVDTFIKVYPEICAKYDLDAIQAALFGGIEAYIKNDVHILKTYEEVGRIFPAPYLKENSTPAKGKKAGSMEKRRYNIATRAGSEAVEGYIFEHSGITFGVHEQNGGSWSVEEFTTGMRVLVDKSRKIAVERIKNASEDFGLLPAVRKAMQMHAKINTAEA